jgi:very-short-patch-repair endonuclease
MNKNAIQKYAVWARNELIAQVKQRAFQYGINSDGYGEENALAIAGVVLSADERQQRQTFIGEIKKNGFQQAVEEVAYTWFNRFVALRFMEVNDYLPTHIRVFSDTSGSFTPEILKDVLHLELPGLDKAKVSELLNTTATEELYRYLLLTQCNALNTALPEMFEKLGGYTEMLLPNNILKSDGILGRLVSDIPEEDWRDAVQIIGWLYQYYNTEPKQAVFDGLKKNVKITKEKIPAATQLFTPDWIVRNMVENSPGRLWLEAKFPSGGGVARSAGVVRNWKYYIPEAEQTPEVAEKLRVLRSQIPVQSPEDIRLIDPCMGSGHILVYAFDVLMQIYESEGYNPRDAAKLILEKNIYGLDIDRRAYQLAYFALIMKARQYNRRILTEGIKPQVYHPSGYPDGEEFGSLVEVDSLSLFPSFGGEAAPNGADGVVDNKPQLARGQLVFEDSDYEQNLRIWNYKRLLSQKYDVVVTNPPYMGSSGMGGKLAEFVKKNYPDSKSDTFSAFIERADEMLTVRGFQSLITMESWMFLSSFEKLRNKIFASKTIINLVHMPYLGKGGTSLGINFGTAAFVMNKKQIRDYLAQYDYICYYETDSEGIPYEFPTINERYKTATAENFTKIPGSPVAYWVSEAMLRAFEVGTPLKDVSQPRQGIATADNNRFLRMWYEVYVDTCGFSLSPEDSKQSGLKWFPYNKGGDFRKWYGNNDYVVNWKYDGSEMKNFKSAAIRNINFHFQPSVTWTLISSSSTAFRYKPQGHLFDVAGMSMFPSEETFTSVLGFCNTSIAREMLSILAPTLNYQVGDIARLPMMFDEARKAEIGEYVQQNIALSRTDWDAFETSWDFQCHPLIPLLRRGGSVEDADGVVIPQNINANKPTYDSSVMGDQLETVMRYNHPGAARHPSKGGEFDDHPGAARHPSKGGESANDHPGATRHPSEGGEYRSSSTYRKLPYNPALKERARELRKAGVLSEVLLWQQLKGGQINGWDFDRQKIIGNYIVDFYIANMNLVVEIDGATHDAKTDYDARRDKYLFSLGLDVIHMLDADVKTRLESVVELIKNHPGASRHPSEGGEFDDHPGVSHHSGGIYVNP